MAFIQLMVSFSCVSMYHVCHFHVPTVTCCPYTNKMSYVQVDVTDVAYLLSARIICASSELNAQSSELHEHLTAIWSELRAQRTG
jgi:hypothetical protein